MKRLHVHLGVADLDKSISFYSGLFGAPPTVRNDDYAKWMIDDPRVNFAISTRVGELGINHLGRQADSADELAGIREHFAAADQASVQDEPGANCCYAKSDFASLPLDKLDRLSLQRKLDELGKSPANAEVP